MSSETATNTTNGNGTAPEWASMQRLAMISGVVGMAAFAVLGLTNSAVGEGEGRLRQFFLSYLVAWVFWLSLPIGCMALLGIQYLVGASWGKLLRRLFEASTRTFPLMVILFIPLAISLFIEHASPYPWADGISQVAKEHEIEPGSRAYQELNSKFSDFLNPKFFMIRVAIYFSIWGLFIFLLNKWGAKVEKDNDRKAFKAVETLSGPLVMAFGIMNMFAATDFVMSLELAWASTMFPVIYSVNQFLTCITLCVALFMTLQTRPEIAKVMRPKFQIDMGSFMLALTLVWTYTSFAQFLLVWAGNLPEEIPFMLKRTRGGWEYASFALGILHFALPFLLLLFRDVKLHPKRLRAVGCLILTLCALDVIWWIEPVYTHHSPLFIVMDFAAIAGIGGIWGWLFINQLKSRPLLPTNELHELPGGHDDHGH